MTAAVSTEDENNHLDPRKVIYIKHAVWNIDDTIGFAWEAPTASHDLKEMIAEAVDEVNEHGGKAYILECRVIRRVERGKAKVFTVRVQP